MKFDTRALLLVASALVWSAPAMGQTLRQAVLRDAAMDAGLVPATETHVQVPESLVVIGKKLFESRLLSFNQDTACASCHLDQFGSSDGLRNAIGTDAEGVGAERVQLGGDIIPRNTLPFWGRGGKGFDIFFWDGKVDGAGPKLHSQFMGQEPSQDPLVVAVHLPPAEIGEMVTDTRGTEDLQTENVETALLLYEQLTERVRRDETLGSELAGATAKSVEQLKFLDIAEAIAAFIRANFQLKSTRFHEFVFNTGELTTEEIAGGLLFYGKARCSTCHNGPYFSDFNFYAIPFPQAGFGKNGFGVDYGRFNVTLNYMDRYKFRTAPLYNISKTAPYSHSGSVDDLDDAIRAHVDPLALYQTREMTQTERADFYERLTIWAEVPLNGVVVSDDEIRALTAFLGTLDYESRYSIAVVD